MSSIADKPSVCPPSKKPRLLTGVGKGASGTASFQVSNSGSESRVTDMEINGSSGNGVNQDHHNGSGNIDEGLYSRQIYVIGLEAMKEMAKANVLISGLGGLGVEIAKNVCLGGVKSVTLHDTANTTWTDLSTQFYLRNADIGKNRAQASHEQLSELNPYVPVHVLTEPLTTELLKDFKLVVFADRVGNEDTVRELSTYCHANNIRFILAETRGVFSRLFCDFGKDFKIYDSNGEPPITAMVANVSQEANGLVACLDETRHGLEDGDYVTFSEVTGMDELNGCEPMQITVTGPFTFTIGDTTGFKEYKRGGIAIQVKQIKTVDFKSFEDSISEPECVYNDFAKLGNTDQLHCGFRALDLFVERNGRLPRPWNEEDAATILELASEVNQTLKTPLENLDEKLLRLFSFVSSGNLSPMNAFLGGVAAQEVMKGCSGKFNPIKQWLYFDAVECLPQFTMEEPWNINEHDFAPVSHRSDGQVAVFGKEFQDKLGNLKYFVVGAGAIGCELLKNFAMMGVGAGDNGEIIVTDMDLIDRSNLNRQFLFRSHDVGKAKSTAAAAAIKAMNHEIKVVAQQNFVDPRTENIYTDEFFERLDGVVNALDNVEARIYMDRRCVYYRKPLLESGTLGTKGNTQVVLPCLTESYGSSQHPPERQIPICNLQHFPNAIEHTLQWARDLFEGVFRDSAKCAADYLNDPNFIANTLRKPGGQPAADLEAVKRCLVDDRPKTIEDCVKWARLLWEENFNNQIQQLLFNFPADQTTTSGQLFWSPPKRCPTPLGFNTEFSNPYSVDFVFTAANLRAEMYGIQQNRNPDEIAQMANAVEVPVFKPRSGIHIAANDAEAQADQQNALGNADSSTVEALLEAIPPREQLTGLRITPLDFEKDDDQNLHIDFIVATSNCRARNYKIEPADRLQSKLIAGKIIPAIATTTSVVGGLVALELIKVAFEYRNLGLYKNGFVNLALPLFTFSEPLRRAQTLLTALEFQVQLANLMNHAALLNSKLKLLQQSKFGKLCDRLLYLTDELQLIAENVYDGVTDPFRHPRALNKLREMEGIAAGIPEGIISEDFQARMDTRKANKEVNCFIENYKGHLPKQIFIFQNRGKPVLAYSNSIFFTAGPNHGYLQQESVGFEIFVHTGKVKEGGGATRHNNKLEATFHLADGTTKSLLMVSNFHDALANVFLRVKYSDPSVIFSN